MHTHVMGVKSGKKVEVLEEKSELGERTKMRVKV